MKVKQLSLDVSNGRLVAILGDDSGARMQIDYVCPSKSDDLHRVLYDARESDKNVIPTFTAIHPPTEQPKKKFTDMGGTAECHGGVKS